MKFVSALCLVLLGMSCTTAMTIPQAWVDEAVGWFEQALQIDSTSLPVPGREGPFVAFLKGILDQECIENVVENVPIAAGVPILQPVLLAFLRGPQGSGNVLLASHSDTVGVGNMPLDKVFAGQNIDGNEVGRGAADMKYKVIYDLCTIVWLNRLQVPLSKGIIYGVFPGEELGLTGAGAAAFFLSPYFQNVILATDEGGGLTVDVLGKTYMPIAVGEKGACVFNLKVNKTDGHATAYQPIEDSALLTMADSLVKAAKTIPPPHYTEVTLKMLDEMKAADKPHQNIYKNLANPSKFASAMTSVLNIDEQSAKFLMPQLTHLLDVVKFQSFTGATITPGLAEGMVAKITIPGGMDNCDITQQELINALANTDVIVEKGPLPGMDLQTSLAFGSGVTVNPNNVHVTNFMNIIKSTAATAMPDVTVTHSIFQAISDCMIWVNYLQTPCIGFEPLRVPAGVYFMDLFHSNYDYVPHDAFVEGLKLQADVIEQFVRA